MQKRYVSNYFDNGQVAVVTNWQKPGEDQRELLSWLILSHKRRNDPLPM